MRDGVRNTRCALDATLVQAIGPSIEGLTGPWKASPGSDLQSSWRKTSQTMSCQNASLRCRGAMSVVSSIGISLCPYADGVSNVLAVEFFFRLGRARRVAPSGG